MADLCYVHNFVLELFKVIVFCNIFTCNNVDDFPFSEKHADLKFWSSFSWWLDSVDLLVDR